MAWIALPRTIRSMAVFQPWLKASANPCNYGIPGKLIAGRVSGRALRAQGEVIGNLVLLSANDRCGSEADINKGLMHLVDSNFRPGKKGVKRKGQNPALHP
jgi:hypothetical protein